MRSIPKESLHPSIIQALEDNAPTVPGSIGIEVEFDDPNVKDAKVVPVIVKDAKQLGVHFMINLQEEDSYLTYEHWFDDTKGAITKRKVARKFAKAWNPLQEMSPIVNPGKICLSHIWKVQKFLEKRLE